MSQRVSRKERHLAQALQGEGQFINGFWVSDHKKIQARVEADIHDMKAKKEQAKAARKSARKAARKASREGLPRPNLRKPAKETREERFRRLLLQAK